MFRLYFFHYKRLELNGYIGWPILLIYRYLGIFCLPVTGKNKNNRNAELLMCDCVQGVHETPTLLRQISNCHAFISRVLVIIETDMVCTEGTGSVCARRVSDRETEGELRF